MADPRAPRIDPTPGLAGGPPPSPPGVSDGTPFPPTSPEVPHPDRDLDADRELAPEDEDDAPRDG